MDQTNIEWRGTPDVGPHDGLVEDGRLMDCAGEDPVDTYKMTLARRESVSWGGVSSHGWLPFVYS